MCTEESNLNSKKQIHHGSFKRHKSRFIFQLNKVASGDFVLPIHPLLGMGVWSYLLACVVSGRNSAPDSLYQQCNLFTATGSGLPVGIPGCKLGESEAAEEYTVYSIRCITGTVCSFPTTATLLYCSSNSKYSGM